jgi:hypothetical protein
MPDIQYVNLEDEGPSWSDMLAQAAGQMASKLLPNPKSVIKKAAKIIPAAAATYFTGGAAAPMLAGALGGSSGLLGAAGGSAMQQAGAGMLGNFAGQLGQDAQGGLDEIKRRQMIAQGLVKEF